MELRHLRYFCAVADYGTFSKASRELHVSQSAISEQIADLEREIGGPLLDRAVRGARLTPQGEVFLEEARKTLLASERAIEMAQRSMQGQVGTLAIGFFLWGAGGFFARIIREYRKLHPKVRLSLYEMHTIPQMDGADDGEDRRRIHAAAGAAVRSDVACGAALSGPGRPGSAAGSSAGWGGRYHFRRWRESVSCCASGQRHRRCTTASLRCVLRLGFHRRL